jgi:peptidylprolyl isomerase
MIKQGSRVRAHYTGRLTDRPQPFDSSIGRDPLEFIVGQGQLIEGFEQAVIGLNPGDKKTVELSPDLAYGPVKDDMIMTVGRDKVPQDVQEGQGLQATLQNGQVVPFVVTKVTDTEVVVDANHPLAGQTLIFDIEILEVEEN